MPFDELSRRSKNRDEFTKIHLALRKLCGRASGPNLDCNAKKRGAARISRPQAARGDAGLFGLMPDKVVQILDLIANRAVHRLLIEYAPLEMRPHAGNVHAVGVAYQMLEPHRRRVRAGGEGELVQRGGRRHPLSKTHVVKPPFPHSISSSAATCRTPLR